MVLKKKKEGREGSPTSKKGKENRTKRNQQKKGEAKERTNKGKPLGRAQLFLIASELSRGRKLGEKGRLRS